MTTPTLVKNRRAANRHPGAATPPDFIMPPLHYAWELAPEVAITVQARTLLALSDAALLQYAALYQRCMAPLQQLAGREILTFHQFIAWHEKLSSRSNSNSLLPT